mgnify:CR=1 FL=1
MAHQKILILDFGSQVSQLIARRVREAGVYCELHPHDADEAFIRAFGPKGIILSGSHASVTEEAPPAADPYVFRAGVPVLGISNTVDGITEMGDHVFRNSLAERVVQPQTVKVAKKRFRLKRVAIVWATPDAYSKSSNAVFRKALRANGVTVTADRSFASDSPAALNRALDAAAIDDEAGR